MKKIAKKKERMELVRPYNTKRRKIGTKKLLFGKLWKVGKTKSIN